MDFMNRIFGEEGEATPEDSGRVPLHDVRIAACALFLEMANIDDEFSGEERETIVSILRDEYDLSEEYASELAEAAEKERKKSLDMWHFTRMINEHFSREEKIRIVELLWKIVYVDGKLDKHEDYLVHTFANMLNLAHKELIEAKLRILYGQDE